MIARRTLTATLLGSTILSALPMMSIAQTAETSDTEVIVTAQKRSERLQNVPMSIQAITTKKIDDLNISNVQDAVIMMPSVSFQASAPGSTRIYMRGVASGGDGNHSSSLPSVGVYLDELPITTIGGSVDVHMYDIARIESLAGPQGTLYGASSQAGTIRVITNKPETTSFYGRFDSEVNSVAHGGTGGSLEGMLNIPINQKMAVRLVGWAQKDAGYIDNVAGTRSFIDSVTVNNNKYIEDNFNTVETYGARAALKVDLDENWTATASLMGQDQRSNGVWGYDPTVGKYQVQHFYPDVGHDRFMSAAVTVQGKVANLEVTYAGATMNRSYDGSSDYTDYAESYDEMYAYYGGIAGYLYITDNAGNDIDPRQVTYSTPRFKKVSHELRIATPADEKLRFIGGAFYQKQTNEIHETYVIPGLASAMSVNGHAGTLWLTRQTRVDKDMALFGELSYDLLPNLTFTAGLRAFQFDNSLVGFYGFGRDIANGPPWNGAGSSRTGVAGCFTSNGNTVRQNYSASITSATLLPGVVDGTPCTNLGVYENGTVVPKVAKGHGTTSRYNLTWKPTDDLMVYGTFSEGFRPGGTNRNADFGQYDPDFLTNYELGAKTTILGGKLRLNGAIYKQDWDTFQYSFLGPNSLTIIQNGPDAEIQGIELEVNYRPIRGLTINATTAYNDAKIKTALCTVNDGTADCSTAGNSVKSPAGTRLPVTPEFKIAGSVRYEWDMGVYKPYWQVAFNSQTETKSAIRVEDSVDLPAYSLFDLAIGAERGKWTGEFYIKNVTDDEALMRSYVQCGACERRYYIPAQPRTMGFRLGSKF